MNNILKASIIAGAGFIGTLINTDASAQRMTTAEKNRAEMAANQDKVNRTVPRNQPNVGAIVQFANNGCMSDARVEEKKSWYQRLFSHSNADMTHSNKHRNHGRNRNTSIPRGRSNTPFN